MNIFIAPFINGILGAYYLVGNLGWAIVLVTVVIRLLLLPLVMPSLKSSKKMAELQPKLKRLQEKYKNDKEGLAKAQMELYKQEGVNPLSGCLPQVAQIGVLILFFSAFTLVTNYTIGKATVGQLNKDLISNFQIEDGFKFNTNFMGSDLTKTPSYFFSRGVGLWLVLPLILLIGSGVLQYLGAKMMMPSSKTALPENKKKENKPVKVDDTAYTKETPGEMDDMMAAMRTQSLYMMPAMTVVIGWNFSLGVLIYWFINSLVMLLQQMAANRMSK